LAFFISASPVQALEINVRKLDGNLIDSFQRAPLSSAPNFLVGYTVLISGARMAMSQTHLIPFSGPTVVYFSHKKKMVCWWGKSKVVHEGSWQIRRSGRFNDICFFFPQGKGEGLCSRLLVSQDFLKESTKGNPFKLKAGGAVPFKLGRFGVSLSQIARKID
jgi:hypothetical protein